MKKNLFLVLVLFVSTNLFAQENDLPKIIGDTLFTTCGYKIIKGDYIKIGTGTMPDGDFKFIRRSRASLFSYVPTNGNIAIENANNANAFSRDHSGMKFKINALKGYGNKKNGYNYVAKFMIGITGYEIDVENAIAYGELVVPDEYKAKPQTTTTVVEVKQQVSVADELTKLKKLYDEGVLTKEEFDAQKAKLLGSN